MDGAGRAQLVVDLPLLEDARAGGGRPGDLVVVVAGSPPSVAGRTNLLRVRRIGEAAAG